MVGRAIVEYRYDQNASAGKNLSYVYDWCIRVGVGEKNRVIKMLSAVLVVPVQALTIHSVPVPHSVRCWLGVLQR